MTKYLIEWEIEGKWDPDKARERIRATKENKIVKAWGLYLGTRKGYAVIESSSEREFQDNAIKLSNLGIKSLSATPFITLEEFENTLT